MKGKALHLPYFGDGRGKINLIGKVAKRVAGEKVGCGGGVLEFFWEGWRVNEG